MTNKDRWNLITSKLPSPQSYIDFGFYYLISLALQRRVWFYEGRDSLYCNLYIVLVGPPAVGKGIILKAIAQLARHHKTMNHGLVKTSIGEELPNLFPVSGDSITFEKLMDSIAASYRHIPTGNPKVPNYGHCSYAFLLEELSSLFKTKTEDVAKFLLNGFDCDQYDYETKHQGVQRLRKLCINFIAGTQLDFLKEAHEKKIFGQGFSSRCIWLFENSPRFETFHIARDLTDPLIIAAEEKLLEWLKKLSTLYGQLTYKPEVYDWLENWLHTTHIPRRDKASPRMLDYLGRKKVMIVKLAAAIHFADSLEMEIPFECFHSALKMLDAIEPKMEAGLNLSGRNPLHIPAQKMLGMIHGQRIVSRRNLILGFGADLSVSEILLCIEELKLGHGIKEVSKPDGVYYCL